MAEEPAVSISAEEILSGVGLALVATDLSGGVVYWNEAAQDMYGWSAEEAAGRQVDELIRPDVDGRTAEGVARALRDGVPWSRDVRASPKNGAEFRAVVTDRGIYRDGRLVGLVGLTGHLGKALRPILERSSDVAVILRPDAVVTYATPSAGRVFGWEDSIVGTSVLPLLHPDERLSLTRFLQDAAADPGKDSSIIELRVQTARGWVWADAALVCMLDDPEVRGVVCSLRSSALRDEHEAAVRQVERLTTALRSRVVIEQAKGFLAGRHGIGVDDAFERLRGYARAHRLDIHEASRRVLAGSIDPR